MVLGTDTYRMLLNSLKPCGQGLTSLFKMVLLGYLYSHNRGKSPHEGILALSKLLSILHHYSVIENYLQDRDCKSRFHKYYSKSGNTSQLFPPFLCEWYRKIICGPHIIYHISYHSDISLKVRRRSGRHGIYTFNTCSLGCWYGNMHLSLNILFCF